MPYAWFDPRVRYAPAADQAASFLDTLSKWGGMGELGPMIDLEDGTGIYGYVGVGTQIKAWLDIVEAELGVKPRIYTNAAYVYAYLFNNSIREDWLNDYGLVIANWGVNSPDGAAAMGADGLGLLAVSGGCAGKVLRFLPSIWFPVWCAEYVHGGMEWTTDLPDYADEGR